MVSKEEHLLVEHLLVEHLLVEHLLVEYPFEHGAVINYTLDGVSIHSVTTKIQAFFLTQFLERKEIAL